MDFSLRNVIFMNMLSFLFQLHQECVKIVRKHYKDTSQCKLQFYRESQNKVTLMRLSTRVSLGYMILINSILYQFCFVCEQINVNFAFFFQFFFAFQTHDHIYTHFNTKILAACLHSFRRKVARCLLCNDSFRFIKFPSFHSLLFVFRIWKKEMHQDYFEEGSFLLLRILDAFVAIFSSAKKKTRKKNINFNNS